MKILIDREWCHHSWKGAYCDVSFIVNILIIVSISDIYIYNRYFLYHKPNNMPLSLDSSLHDYVNILQLFDVYRAFGNED